MFRSLLLVFWEKETTFFKTSLMTTFFRFSVVTTFFQSLLVRLQSVISHRKVLVEVFGLKCCLQKEQL